MFAIMLVGMERPKRVIWTMPGWLSRYRPLERISWGFDLRSGLTRLYRTRAEAESAQAPLARYISFVVDIDGCEDHVLFENGDGEREPLVRLHGEIGVMH